MAHESSEGKKLKFSECDKHSQFVFTFVATVVILFGALITSYVYATDRIATVTRNQSSLALEIKDLLILVKSHQDSQQVAYDYEKRLNDIQLKRVDSLQKMIEDHTKLMQELKETLTKLQSRLEAGDKNDNQ